MAATTSVLTSSVEGSVGGEDEEDEGEEDIAGYVRRRKGIREEVGRSRSSCTYITYNWYSDILCHRAGPRLGGLLFSP